MLLWGGPRPFRRLPGWDSPWPAPPPGQCPWPREACSLDGVLDLDVGAVGLSERQGGALGLGEPGRIPPGGHREEALVRFAFLLEVAGVHVDADAAAMDLARPQLD